MEYIEHVRSHRSGTLTPLATLNNDLFVQQCVMGSVLGYRHGEREKRPIGEPTSRQGPRYQELLEGQRVRQIQLGRVLPS